MILEYLQINLMEKKLNKFINVNTWNPQMYISSLVLIKGKQLVFGVLLCHLYVWVVVVD